MLDKNSHSQIKVKCEAASRAGWHTGQRGGIGKARWASSQDMSVRSEVPGSILTMFIFCTHQ